MTINLFNDWYIKNFTALRGYTNVALKSPYNKKCGRFSFVDGRLIFRSMMAYFIIFPSWDPSLYCL